MRCADLIGAKLGHLTVVSIDWNRSNDKRTYFFCRCLCGGMISRYRSNLLNAKYQSCGCVSQDINVATHTTHGFSAMPEYGVWIKMWHRCYNPASTSYARYGARGICMSVAWYVSIKTFLQDMGPRPSPLHQIERVDNNGNYCKGNCVWAIAARQARNRRSNVMLTYAGKTQCLEDWAIELGRKRETISYRLRAGWSICAALTRQERRI